MKFEKEEHTHIRYEKDGIYILNSKYQTKEKITDLAGKGKIFYEAVHSYEVENPESVQKFIEKKFLVPQ